MSNPIAPASAKKTEPIKPSVPQSPLPQVENKVPDLSEKIKEEKAEAGVSYTDVFRIKIGGKPGEATESEMIFDLYKGEIFTPYAPPYYECYIHKQRDRRSYALFHLKDPDFSILGKLNRDDNVEIEVGRHGILTLSKFVGTIWKFGAVYNPNGCFVMALDKSASATTPANAIQPSMSEAVGDTIAPPPDLSKIEINTQADVMAMMKDLSAASENGRKRITSAENAFAIMVDKNGNPRFSDKSNLSIDTAGKALFNQSPIAAATKEAALVGDSVVTQGNTTAVISPGNEPDSGVILDLGANASLFRPGLKIIRPGILEPNSPYGAFIVRGHDIRTGETVGATVVRQAPDTPHPTGAISVPQWKDIKLSDPIFEGCPYTWADATKNGSRVPENQAIVEGIVRVAQVITKYTRQTVGTGKWTITSWYRPPAANRAAGSSSGSRHLRGDAVDFNFPGMDKLYAELKPLSAYEGGIAISPGAFVHIDTYKDPAKPPRRWQYR